MLYNNKTVELTDEDLEKTSGGDDNNNDNNNPKGLNSGDSVFFYNCEWFVWMWGIFKSYTCDKYIIEWNETTIFVNGITLTIPASFTYVSGEDIE